MWPPASAHETEDVMGEHDQTSSGRPRTKAARLTFIGEAVNKHGFVTVDDLAEQLGVSRMTVHRDLDELQGRGSLRKVRGGASAHRSTQYESDLQFRSTSAVAEKKLIARAAAELTNEGDVVLIDDSTSALEMLPHLISKAPLTIITNFLVAMERLAGHPEVNVIGLGGEYVPRYQAYLGMICEGNLANLYTDVLFASTSSMRGLDLYHQDQRVVMAKRAMLATAERRVLLLDHTKVGHGALHRLCGVNEFTHVVVDDQVERSVIKSIEEADVEVIVAT